MNVYRVFLTTEQTIDILADNFLEAINYTVKYLRQQGNEIDESVIIQIHLLSSPIFYEEPTGENTDNVP